jgi:hypothetical protein
MSQTDLAKSLSPKHATVQQAVDGNGVALPSSARLLWQIALSDYRDAVDYLYEKQQRYGDEEIGGVQFDGDWLVTQVGLTRDGPYRERSSTFVFQDIERANPDNSKATPTEAIQSSLTAPDGHSESKGDQYRGVRADATMVTGSIPVSTGYIAKRRTVVKRGALADVSIDQDKIYDYLTGSNIAEPEIYRFKEGSAQVNTWRNIDPAKIDAHVTAATTSCFGNDEVWNSGLTEASGLLPAADGSYWAVTEINKTENATGSFDLAIVLQWSQSSTREAIVVSWQYVTIHDIKTKNDPEDVTKRYSADDTYIKGTKVEFFYSNAQNVMMAPTPDNVSDTLLSTSMSKVVTNKGTELYMITATWLRSLDSTWELVV